MTAKTFPIGFRTGNKTVFNFPIPENTQENKTNIFMLGKQGIGKTNLIFNYIYFMYKLYLETEGKYGCIPIVFSPTFEYTKISGESHVIKGKYPPRTKPVGIKAIHYSFKLANIPPYLKKRIKVVKLNFSELTTEDISIFCGLGGDSEGLGKIEKYIEFLTEQYGKDYTVDNFLNLAKEENAAPFNSLYYVFKRLKENGLFDDSLESFDWYSALKERKPICFHFGEIEDVNVLQALAGILLRKLFSLSNKYLNAVYKTINIRNLGRNPEDYLGPEEKWFLKNFVVGLFFEEAHQFFPPTTTKILRSFPAHRYFRLISMALGRKRNFKFNFLVSQRLELLYKEFRTEFDFLFTGSKVDATDKFSLREIFRHFVPSQTDLALLISSICGNKQFEFTVTDLNGLNRFVTKIQRGEKPLKEDAPLTKFKAYVAPCGME